MSICGSITPQRALVHVFLVAVCLLPATQGSAIENRSISNGLLGERNGIFFGFSALYTIISGYGEVAVEYDRQGEWIERQSSFPLFTATRAGYFFGSSLGVAFEWTFWGAGNAPIIFHTDMLSGFWFPGGGPVFVWGGFGICSGEDFHEWSDDYDDVRGSGGRVWGLGAGYEIRFSEKIAGSIRFDYTRHRFENTNFYEAFRARINGCYLQISFYP